MIVIKMYLRLNDQIKIYSIKNSETLRILKTKKAESAITIRDTKLRSNSLTKFSHLFNCPSDQLFILINSEDWEKSESCLFLFCY